MDAPVRQSNFMILRGIFPEDFISQNYRDDVTEQQEGASTQYAMLPAQFTGVGTWPKSSGLKCWNCDQAFVTWPKFIPVNMCRNGDGDEVCDVYGNFDEWNCAVRYVEKEMPADQRWDTLQAIYLFESKFSGVRKARIPPAPPKVLMKEYCGERGLTVAQYRDRMSRLNSDYSSVSLSGRE